MGSLKKSAPLWLLLPLALAGCAPDRMPPAPVEITRPLFKNFAPEDSTTIAVTLRDPVAMHFNEAMDLRSFGDNFTLSSKSGVIPGYFTQAGGDSTVIFTPSRDMFPAEIHVAEIRGGVKDARGNSMNIDPAFAIHTWFFTTGQYAQDGYAHVYVTDRVVDKLYVLGDFDQNRGEITSVQRPRGIVFTPGGDRLLIVNNINEGVLSVFDASSEQKLADVAVGRGPTDVVCDETSAYVLNLSGQTVSVVDLATLREVATLTFSDGFRPRHIALANQKLFLTSNDLAARGRVKIVDKVSLAPVATLDNVLTAQRSARALASSDGRWIYIPEERSARIAIIDAATDQVLPAVDSPQPQNTDGVLDGRYAYISVNAGMIFKFSLATHAVEDTALAGTSVEGVGLSPGGELLYAATPNDTSVTIFETSTMTRLGRAVVGTTIQKPIVGYVKF